ncbi:TlpA family protein disulfide reductase [Actinomadura sp. HBU206391]|uniref:TlpA family protein disulfide reductase n=1 Tax=Actinomadura sp. HBU206391 TaxID=2731692 RepID=UPI00164F95FE|nr:hypothetical protein [Actinomadura sp. HBU206391]MBC6461737.1 hypothetical protein [Actinomadura sp. HBU206391]
MPFLVAGMVLVGLMCAVDLLLTMAVIRRLREHTEQLADLRGGGDPSRSLLPAGSRLPTFEVRSVDGEVIDSETSGHELVAFLSTDCSVCLEESPELVRFIHAQRIDRSAAAVVVIGDDGPQAQHLVDELRSVAGVIREPWDGPVGRAFSAQVFPVFYLVSDGVVQGGSISIGGLNRSVRA